LLEKTNNKLLEKTNNNEPLNRFNKKCQVNIIIKNSIAIELLIFGYQMTKAKCRQLEKSNKRT